MDGLPEELTTLKEEVIHGGVQFDDVAEARDRSQRMKQVMMTTPSRLVKEVTRMKEEATKLNDELDSRDALGKKMQQEKQQLQFEVKNLKEDTAMRIKRAEKKSLDYHKVKADADTYETAVDQAVSSKQEASLPYDNGGMYLRFLTGRNETLLKLRCAAARFDSFGLIDAKAWSAGPRTDPQSLSYLLQEVADFKTVLDEARTELPILEKLQGRLAQSDFPCDVDLEEYRGALEAAEAAHDGWDKKVTAEEERRVNYEACVDEFMKELSRLVDWCKAQRQTLSQLQTTENVQEFCASLQGRIPMMEENFSVLNGMGEDLIPGPQQDLVEKMLVNVNRTWIDLQIYSYERLREAYLDEHSKCGLKDEAQMFSQWASRNVKNFLDNAEELLCTPDEKESQGIVRPVLDLCKTLKKDYPAHQLITGHIADFDVRMEVINDHYRHLKKTILSPLTLLCQKLNAFDTGYHRKDEYEQRIRDIHDWVEIRDANSSSWKTVHEKLSEVRQALELELEVDSFAG